MVPFGNFGWNFGFGFGWLIVIVSLLLVVFAIVQLVRTMSTEKGEKEQDVCNETPSDALKRRYAKGEITKEEFEQKQTELEVMDKKAA